MKRKLAISLLFLFTFLLSLLFLPHGSLGSGIEWTPRQKTFRTSRRWPEPIVRLNLGRIGGSNILSYDWESGTVVQIPTNEYRDLYDQALVRGSRLQQIEAIIRMIMVNKSTYDLVSLDTGVPWWCVAAIHNLESGLNFTEHLHNGDSLMRRTVHVPKGRPIQPPASGHLPYAWYESAIDALHMAWHPQAWTFSDCFEFLERYNGLGYRARGIHSPYLWASTSQYEKGLFVADGKFDPNAVSVQVGAAALLKIMEQNGLVAVNN